MSNVISINGKKFSVRINYVGVERAMEFFKLSGGATVSRQIDIDGAREFLRYAKEIELCECSDCEYHRFITKKGSAK